MGDTIKNGAVHIDAKDGVNTIEQGTPLTRLHYFDGKFLRADDLTLEQDYQRMLVRLANMAGGWGVVHGFGIRLNAARLALTPGLAMTPAGSTVLLSSAIEIDISRLLAEAEAEPAPANPPLPGVSGSADFGHCDCQGPDGIATSASTGYYEITVGPVQGLCGQEEVYGKLCEDACVTDSQSPYWKEGVVLRLRPITLSLPGSSAVPPAAVHLRNRVASAYFAAEPWLTASLLSAAGLRSQTWCNPAVMYTRDELPIGLLVQNGSVTQFIDAWSARRERMDSQARGYWQGRMMMRPWNVFLAQILQFQCQLASALDGGTVPPGDDCHDLRDLLSSSLRELELVQLRYAESSRRILTMLGENAAGNDMHALLDNPGSRLARLSHQLAAAQALFGSAPSRRLLLDRGFMELPPAGYLPVDPAQSPVNDQLQRLFGEGVRLFFCSARPDYIPHAVEEAQHMQRISLTRGLDNPQQIEDVEIFVPNGIITDARNPTAGSWWSVSMTSRLFNLLGAVLIRDNRPANDNATLVGGLNGSATEHDVILSHLYGSEGGFARSIDASGDQRFAFDLGGLARTVQLDGGGAALTLISSPLPAVAGGTTPARSKRATTQYFDLRISQDPFARQEGEQVPVDVEIRVAGSLRLANGSDIDISQCSTGSGKLTVQALYAVDNQTQGLDGLLDLRLSIDVFPDTAEVRDRVDAGGEHRIQLPVSLQRQGDARSGRTLILPHMGSSDREQPGWLAAWQGQPRSAAFGLFRTDGGTSYDPAGTLTHSSPGDYLYNRALYNRTLYNRYLYNRALQPPSYSIPAPTVDNFFALVEMQELNAMPLPESPLRLQALNQIDHLASIAGDNGFRMRARRLLFPSAQAGAAGEVLVRATLDWVMFRRRRHADCDQRCMAPVTPALDSLQTWHVRLDTADQLDQLLEAIDENDASIADRFNFQRVDVLHYAGDGSNPAEPLGQIVGDWQLANPGVRTLAARTWLQQGAASGTALSRLQRLTQMLSSVTAPPPAAQLRTLPAAPTVLSDDRFTGGMLLATTGSDTTLHRVYIVGQQHADEQYALLNQGGAGVRAHLEKYAVYKTNLAADSANVFPAAALDALKQKFSEFQPVQAHALQLLSQAAAGHAAAVDKRHQGITAALGPTVGSGSPFNVAEADFGSGIEAASVIYYANIN